MATGKPAGHPGNGRKSAAPASLLRATSSNNGSYDFSVSLQLTERVVVSEQNGALHVKHLPGRRYRRTMTRPMQLFVHGEW